MLILRGAPALSTFRHEKLFEQLLQKVSSVSGLYAEFAHFVEVSAALSSEEGQVLSRLLKYGPSVPSQEPSGRLFLVVPRFGTISPWSSKQLILLKTAVSPKYSALSAVWRITSPVITAMLKPS